MIHKTIKVQASLVKEAMGISGTMVESNRCFSAILGGALRRHLPDETSLKRGKRCALSLWKSDRLIFNKDADRNAKKHGTWKEAALSEIGVNQTPTGFMLSGSVVGARDVVKSSKRASGLNLV